MEENKTIDQQNVSEGGGHRRRRRHKHKHHGNGANNQPQNAQNQGKQPQNQGKQPQNQGQNAQKQGQNAQKQGQNQNGQGKHKNKHGQPQSQNAQGGQNAQNKTMQKQSQNHQQNNQQNKNNNKNNDRREENRKDTYAYTLDGNLYINLTNKCSNGCDFCVRNERSSYYGNYLWLKNGDPTAEKVISAVNGMGDLSRFKEVVFCGFGEPTYRVAEMVALCDYFHGKGLKTRLNTNGQGNLINKRDIVPELKDKIDFVNISLNASCAEKYQPICRSQFREAGFTGLLDFARLCRQNGINCRFSIVDCIGEEEIEACKRLAESIKIPLYVRKYIVDS